jgi:CDP-6-deoxy-D-xylo-4-hexulose-3-dehydrase
MIRYPLATTTWDDAEIQAIHDVIARDRYTMGEKVREFEAAFAAHFGVRYAVMVNSGSSANLLMLAALSMHPDTLLPEGSEVIVPAVSWSTTYYPVHQHGARLRFVDVDPHTLNMDVAAVEAAIGPDTRAVLAVNLLGNPVQLDALRQLCDERGLVLLEDNCESMGATLAGRQAGTFGLMGTFSCFFSHHISTMEGGLILTDDAVMADFLVSLRAHGWTRELGADNHVFPKSGRAFDDLYRFVLPGYNVRPLEMSGAIGLHQLAKLPGLVSGRRANAVLFTEMFAHRSDLRVQRETGASSWFGFSFICQGDLAGRRDALVEWLMKAGIEVRPIVAGNFARNPVLSRLRHVEPGPLPGADEVHDQGFFVGNHHYPIAEPLEHLRQTIVQFRLHEGLSAEPAAGGAA